MSEMKPLGHLSQAVIDQMKKAKLMTVVRGTEVWVDDEDLKKAQEILKSIDGVKEAKKENHYRFHGYVIKVPEHVKIDQRYIGGLSEKTGTTGRYSIIEFAKPSDGLDAGNGRKQIGTVSLKKTSVELNASAFVPAYSGIVMNDDNGIPLFEITPFNIFVLFDTRVNPAATKQIYEVMLIYAIMLADGEEPKSREVFDKIWLHQAKDREKYEIKQFRDMFMTSIKAEVDSLEQQITREERQIQDYRNKLFQSAKFLDEGTLRLAGLKENGEKIMEKKAEDEWGRIRALEKSGHVKNIRVTPTKLAFRTRMIKWAPATMTKTFHHPTERASDGTDLVARRDDPIELGEYEVTVTLGTQFGVTITNMTKTLKYEAETWHHPHVKNGKVCYGNMDQTIPEFAAKRNFEAIMMCFLKWLENVDVADSWGMRIYHWIADHNDRADERKKRKEKEERAREAMEKAAAAAAVVEAKAKADAEAKKKEAEAAALVKAAMDKEAAAAPVVKSSERVVRFITE